MCAKRLCKMSGIAEARQWADILVRREARGPGDLENAMRRLSARHDIPWRTFWTLRYRPPGDILHGVFESIRAAYEAELTRQIRLLNHELEITKAKAGPDARAVRAGMALVDAADGE